MFLNVVCLFVCRLLLLFIAMRQQQQQQKSDAQRSNSWQSLLLSLSIGYIDDLDFFSPEKYT